LKGVLQRDEAGKIIYPIIINSSLSILDLGEVEYERTNYHSEKNLFPIGFKSLREHNSQKKLGERCLYTCEITDGGNKPQFKVTPMDNEANPLIRDSSTGCWVSFYVNKCIRSIFVRRLTKCKEAREIRSQSVAQKGLAWLSLMS